MKKVITLLIISSLILGAFSTAFADETDDISMMITEGKIQAAMNQQEIANGQVSFKNQILIVNSTVRSKILVLQDRIAIYTESTDESSNGALSALGQVESLLIDLEAKTKAANEVTDRRLLNEIAKLTANYSKMVDHIEATFLK